MFIVSHPALQIKLASSVGLQISLMLMSILGLIPLYVYKDKHPINLLILAGWVGFPLSANREWTHTYTFYVLRPTLNLNITQLLRLLCPLIHCRQVSLESL